MSDEVYGLFFPFQIDPATGGLATQSGDDKIKQNIVQILLTGVGERLMRRDYGGGVAQLVHDPNNVALQAIVQHQVARSIGQWEPRVLLQEVNVTQDEGTLTVQLSYVIRRTHQPQSLSVPFGLGGI